MNALESLEDLNHELVRRGLPAEYAARSTAELIDHGRDLAEQLCASGASIEEADAEALQRLGEPRMLLKNLTREYRRRHFCGRWPFVSFILAPMPVFCCAWTLTLVVTMLAYKCVTAIGAAAGVSASSPALRTTMKLVCLWTPLGWILPAYVTLLFYHLARRAGCDRRWVLASVAQFAFFAGVWSYSFNLTTGMVQFRPPLLQSLIREDDLASILRWYIVEPSQLVQFVLPLITFGILAGTERRRGGAILDSSGATRGAP